MEWLYMALAFLLGGIGGANLIIWLNGCLIRGLAELVETQNDLLTAMAEAFFKEPHP